MRDKQKSHLKIILRERTGTILRKISKKTMISLFNGTINFPSVCAGVNTVATKRILIDEISVFGNIRALKLKDQTKDLLASLLFTINKDHIVFKKTVSNFDLKKNLFRGISIFEEDQIEEMFRKLKDIPTKTYCKLRSCFLFCQSVSDHLKRFIDWTCELENHEQTDN